MAEDDSIKKLEARLTRLEAAVSQSGAGGGTTAGFNFGPIADPVPYPWPPYGGGWGGWRPHPIVDSATFANSALGRVGPVGDPPPPDVSRFSISQLEATLHSINAEKARLSAVETLVTQQLEKLRGQQQG
jgi:hypothetical protein